MALSDIDEVTADETVHLPPKKRSLLRFWLASALRSWWMRFTAPADDGALTQIGAQRSGSDLERRSKGAGAVLPARAKRSRADFATTRWRERFRMRPYSVEIFRPDFTMVGNTNVNEVTYKEDYLTSDENTITVLAMAGIEKQDFIRISRGSEEYAGVVTEIGYGTDRSKRLQTISYKPLVELLNTGILFDVNAQGQGTLEEFICDRIRETFIDNPDTLQNIHGLSVAHTSATPDWSLHITPAESGGHYNIVNLMDSVIVPAMQKYGILVKAALDIQNREIHVTVGRVGGGVLVIEADLPNIVKKSVTIKQVSADLNKLVLYDSADYANHPHLLPPPGFGLRHLQPGPNHPGCL